MKHLSRSILVIFIFLISAQIAYSCSCFRLDLEDEFEDTKYIFVGKIIEITEDKTYVPPKIDKAPESIQERIDTTKRYFVKFKVKKNFKGLEDDEITIVNYEQENPLCGGIYFVKGKKYLIFADKDKDKNEINANGICSRTTLFDKKSEEYKELTNFIKKKKS